MNKLIIIITLTCLFSATSYAARGGLCLNPAYTEYVCCGHKGGWIVDQPCGAPASDWCEEDTGLIAGTNISILAHCKKHGGSKVTYPF